MRVFRLLSLVIVLALALGACTQAPAPTVAPAPTQPPAGAAQPTSAPAAPTAASSTAGSPTLAPAAATVAPTKAAPTAAPTKAPTKAPTAAPTKAASAAAARMPDPKQDPMAALLYASSEANWRSATFTYTMNMSMAPADDASEEAMGEQAAVLAAINIEATGEGAMEVVDAKIGKANMQMNFDMSAMGEQMTLQMVMIGDTAWVRMGDSGPWQKSSAEQAGQTLPGGNPADLMETFKDATQVTYVDSKPLNGEPAHHLRFKMDPGKMDVSAMVNSARAASGGELDAEEMEALLNDMNIEVDVWLGGNDLVVRRQQMAMAFVVPIPDMSGSSATPAAVTPKIRMTVDMTMAFKDVNKPVKIVAPE